MTSTDTTPTPANPAQSLADLAETVILAGPARIFLTPAHGLCPGDVILLSEFEQVTALRAGRDTITATNGFGTEREFAYDAWLLIFRPAHPAQQCRGCSRAWFQGCEEGCASRYDQLEPERVIEVLAQAGLLAPGVLSPYPF